MVFLKIVTTIQADKMVEFEQAVDYILKSDRSGPESIHRGLYRDWRCHNALLYLEEWQTMKDLKNHMSGDLFKSLLGAMKVLGSITSAEVISSNSVETLEKIK